WRASSPTSTTALSSPSRSRASSRSRATRRWWTRSSRCTASAATCSWTASTSSAGRSPSPRARCSCGRRSRSRSAPWAPWSSPSSASRKRRSRYRLASGSASTAKATSASRSSRTSSGSSRRCAASSTSTAERPDDPPVTSVGEVHIGLLGLGTVGAGVVKILQSQRAMLEQRAGCRLALEAAVAGGIPLSRAVKEGLAANSILSLAGIVNGTCNYILSKMTDEGIDFSLVLKEAQAQGYAEADPTLDIEGMDSAHKLQILVSLAFRTFIDLKDIHTEGIARVTAADIAY